MGERPCAVCGQLYRPSALKKCGPDGEICHPCYDAHTARLIAEGRAEAEAEQALRALENSDAAD